MPFPEFTVRRKALTIADLVVAVIVSALVLAAVSPSRGSAHAWLGVPLVPLGVMLWWLSGVELKGWLRKFRLLVFPAYFLLTLAYVAFLVMACLLDTPAVVLILCAQGLTLFYVVR